MLRLATVRSHDQFNTTIYSYSDRYRGVYNDRMVLFMNADDRAERGLAPKARVAVETISGDGVSRRVEGLTVIDYRSEEHTSELQSLMRLSYAGFCLKKKKRYTQS